jgi:hypothetical protein
MKNSSTRYIFVSATMALLLTGCAGSNDRDQRLSIVEQRLGALEKKAENLEAKLSQSTALANTNTSATTQHTAPVAAPPISQDRFADIAGKFGEEQISNLKALKVFEPLEGNFEPLRPVTRAEFVRWLVRTNNAISGPDQQIRVADQGTQATFSDVPANHPDFSYIQGLADAGYSIGYKDKTFRPDRILTREEMIGIKGPLDYGSHEGAYQHGPTDHWADAKKISKDYWNTLNNEAGAGEPNVKRIYGQIKSLTPQKQVTRAEAAVCVWKIKDKTAGTSGG